MKQILEEFLIPSVITERKICILILTRISIRNKKQIRS